MANNTIIPLTVRDYSTCKFGDQDLLINIHLTLSLYFGVPSFILGIPGNIIIVLIASKRSNRKNSSSIYMTAMAIVDSGVVVTSMLLGPLFYGGVMKHSRNWQYISGFVIIITCSMLSGFYLTAMSVDRAIAVRFPMAASRLCTRSRAKKIVLIGSIVLTIANSNLFYTIQYIRDVNTSIENLIVNIPGEEIWTQVAAAFQLVFGTVLPFTFIIICNIVIIITVRGASRKRADFRTTNDPTTKLKETAHLTRMLIFVSAAYLVTSIPYRLFLMVMIIPQVSAIFDFTKTCDFLLYNVIVVSFLILWLFNYCLNFYMYCLGGGKKYRNDIKELFARCWLGRLYH